MINYRIHTPIWRALLDALLNNHRYTEFYDDPLRIDYVIKGMICLLLGRTNRPPWNPHDYDNGHDAVEVWCSEPWSIMSFDCSNAKEWEYIQVGEGWHWNTWWIEADIDGNC